MNDLVVSANLISSAHEKERDDADETKDANGKRCEEEGDDVDERTGIVLILGRLVWCKKAIEARRRRAVRPDRWQGRGFEPSSSFEGCRARWEESFSRFRSGRIDQRKCPQRMLNVECGSEGVRYGEGQTNRK